LKEWRYLTLLVKCWPSEATRSLFAQLRAGGRLYKSKAP
jgi:hypothetical protein